MNLPRIPQFPFPIGEVKLLDLPPLEFTPIPLPSLMQDRQSQCRLNREPSRIEVRVMSIDGVPQRNTYLRLRPATVAKIEEEIRRAKECPLDPSDE